MDQFLLEDHPLDEYAEMIQKYKELGQQIPLSMYHTIIEGMYIISRAQLLNTLQDMANGLRDSLLDKLNTVYQTNCRILGEMYQSVSDKLLTEPTSTAELMDLIAYEKQVTEKILPFLEEQLRSQVMEYILYIMDHIEVSAVELKQNNQTFQWYLRMPKVLEENKVLVEKKTIEFQQTLQKRIKKFTKELEFYKRKVDKLEHNGDLSKIDDFVELATKLDNRLILAMQKIEAFNEEEESYGWELSQYPIRKQVHDKLRPYKQLYDACQDFLTKQQLWLTSKIGSFDPEEIESEVSTSFRNVYKLEKQFHDKPATKELAQMVNITAYNHLK